MNLDAGSLFASLQAPGKGSRRGEGREQPLKLVPQMDFKGTLWAAEKGVSDPTGGQARNHKMRVDPALIMSVTLGSILPLGHPWALTPTARWATSETPLL